MRERLAKIGIMASDFKDIPFDKGMAFLTISHELDKIEREAQEKAAKASRRGK